MNQDQSISISKKWYIRTLLGSILFITMALGCAGREKLLRNSFQHYEFGVGFLSAGNLFEASKEFKRSVDFNPENDKAYFGLGITHYLLGEFEQAIHYYQSAISINPSVPEYYNNIAACYAKLEKWEEVIHYCFNALKVPSYSSPEFAYYNIGMAYLSLDELSNAVEYLTKSKGANPDYIDTSLQLGKAFIRLKDFQAAIGNLDDAKKISMTSSSNDLAQEVEIEYYRGEALLGLHNYPAARSSFESVIERLPRGLLAEKSAQYLKFYHKQFFNE